MSRPPGSDTTTRGIRVQAAAQYMPAESDPSSGRFLYAYRIRLSNEGTQRAKLRARHWIILDADNRRDDVRGAGVIGKQPELGAGESFEYTSQCMLKTRWGTMEGSYTFERDDGSTFQAEVGRFFLVPSAPRIAIPLPKG